MFIKLVCLLFLVLAVSLRAGETLIVNVDISESGNVRMNSNPSSGTSDGEKKNVDSVRIAVQNDDTTPYVVFVKALKGSRHVNFFTFNVPSGQTAEETKSISALKGLPLKISIAKKSEPNVTVESLETGVLQSAGGVSKAGAKDPVVENPQGIPFHDALAIKNNNLSKVARILSYYRYENKYLYKDNPFLRDLNYDQIADGVSDIKSADLQSSVDEVPLPSVYGLDVTTLADGMAKFLVKRTKLELSVAFFDKFKKFLDDTQHIEMRMLFPMTWATLSAIDRDIYNFNAYMQTLRESFEKDLQCMPDHLRDVIRNSEIEGNAKAAILQMLYLAVALRDGDHPGIIIENLPVDDAESVLLLKGGLQTLQLVSGSLRDTAFAGGDTGAYWVSRSDVKKLVTDRQALRIYLGLLYQQARKDDIRFESSQSLCDIMRLTVDKLSGYERYYEKYFLRFSRGTDNVTAGLRKSRSKPADSIAPEKYYSYVNSVADVIDGAIDWNELIPGNAAKIEAIHSKIRKYTTAARSATSIPHDVKTKNYASLIVNVVSIMKSCIPDNADTIKVVRDLLKYGTFMATVAQAENADEVESAIEAFALPPGSAAIKRSAKFDVAINAYVGMFGGKERSVEEEVSDSWEWTTGVTAPIGVAFSTSKASAAFPLNWVTTDLFYTLHLGCHKLCKTICSKYSKPTPRYVPWFSSFTIFASAIDLGAVTAYRFDDSLSTMPELTFENIIAPGIYAVFGINSCPVSIGGGIQSGPQLRAVKDSEAEIDEVSGYRWSVFAAVDIPLWTIYTR